MKHTLVGQSGLEVSELGVGTLTWGRDTEDDDARRILSALLDHGGNLIDTAPVYGGGAAIATLGALIGEYASRGELVINLHVGLYVGRDGVQLNLGRRQLIASVDEALQTLGTDYIDIVTLAAPDPAVPLAETLQTAGHLVNSGKARYLGFANHPAWRSAMAYQYMEDHQLASFVSLNEDYSLLNRRVERDVVPFARAAGLGIFAQSPLAGGVLTGKYRHTIPPTSRAATVHLSGLVEPFLADAPRRMTEAVAKAADGLGRTPADISLAWLLGQPQAAAVLCGARTGSQFEQILALDIEPLPGPVAQALSDVTDPERLAN